MYAIVEIAGQQFKVEPGKKIFVHRLEVTEGNKVEINKVLLLEDEGVITIGDPLIKDAVIEGSVVDHVRGDKVIVFKKKRKKGYRIKNGHRQNFTQVEILSINGKTAPKRENRKEESPVAAETAAVKPVKEKKAATKKPADEKKTQPAAKKAPAAKKSSKSKEK
jgi:large subunit ribosomal protein L21